LLDPATSLVHQVKVRCYTKPLTSNPGAVGAGMPGGGGGGNEEEDEPKAAKTNEPVYEGGLPVRKPKAREMLVLVKHDVTFARRASPGPAEPAPPDAPARGWAGGPPAECRHRLPLARRCASCPSKGAPSAPEAATGRRDSGLAPACAVAGPRPQAPQVPPPLV